MSRRRLVLAQPQAEWPSRRPVRRLSRRQAEAATPARVVYTPRLGGDSAPNHTWVTALT